MVHTYSQVKLSLKKPSFHLRRLSGWRWSKAWGYPNWSGLFIRMDFLAHFHHFKVSWIHENAGKPDDIAGNTLEIRLEITHHNLQERKKNPRLFVVGCSVFDLKTLISEAKSANRHQQAPFSFWQTSATLNRCLGGCQVLIPFLLVQ